MKKISIFTLSVGLFMCSFTLNAQKVGNVDAVAIFNASPEMKKADEELQAQATTVRGEIEKMGKALQAKYEQYQKEAPTQTQDANTKRAQEVEAEQQKIQEFQQNAAKELEAKQLEKFKPIREKIQNAINKVAKAKGITYVFDSSQSGIMVYVDAATAADITADVKKELGYN